MLVIPATSGPIYIFFFAVDALVQLRHLTFTLENYSQTEQMSQGVGTKKD